MIQKGGEIELTEPSTVIMWDRMSVAKSTGGVRLVGPEARMNKRGREKW